MRAAFASHLDKTVLRFFCFMFSRLLPWHDFVNNLLATPHHVNHYKQYGRHGLGTANPVLLCMWTDGDERSVALRAHQVAGPKTQIYGWPPICSGPFCG